MVLLEVIRDVAGGDSEALEEGLNSRIVCAVDVPTATGEVGLLHHIDVNSSHTVGVVIDVVVYSHALGLGLEDEDCVYGDELAGGVNVGISAVGACNYRFRGRSVRFAGRCEIGSYTVLDVALVSSDEGETTVGDSARAVGKSVILITDMADFGARCFCCINFTCSLLPNTI